MLPPPPALAYTSGIVGIQVQMTAPQQECKDLVAPYPAALYSDKIGVNGIEVPIV